MTQPTADKPKRTRRRKVVRFMGWTVGGTILLLLVVFVGAFVGVLGALSALDNPTVANRVSRVVQAETGLRMNYQVLDVAPFSGLRIEGLRMASPAAYRAHAPDLIRLERLEVGWSIWPLLSGRIQVDPVVVEGLTLSLVTDRAGGSSLDGLVSGPPAEPAAKPDEPVPLSGLLARALPTVDVQSVRLAGLRAELIQVADGRVVRRISVGGPELSARLQAAGGELDLEFALRGAQDQGGIRVQVEEAPGTPEASKREAILDLDLRLATRDPQTIGLKLDLAAVKQDLVARLPAKGPLAKIEAQVSFDPAGHRTLVEVTEADLLQGAATATLAAALVEADSGVVAPVVERLQVDLDATRVLESLEIELPGLALQDASLQARAEQVSLAPEAGVPVRGTFSLDAQVGQAAFDRDGARASVEGLSVQLRGETASEGGLDLQATIGARTLQAGLGADGQPGPSTSAADLKLDLRAEGLKLQPGDTLRSQGGLTVRARIASLAADQADQRVTATGLQFEADSRLTGELPLRGKLRLPIERVALSGRGLGQVELSGLDLVAEAGALFPDFSSPSEAKVDLGLRRVQLRRRGERITAQGLLVRTRARVADPEHMSASVQVPVGRLELRQGKNALRLRKLNLDLKIDDATVPSEAPARTSAKIALRTTLGSLRAGTAGMKAVGQGLGLDLDVHLDEGTPRGFSGAVPMHSLAVTARPGGARLASVDRGRLGFELDRLRFVAGRPENSRGRLRMDLKADRIGLRPGTSFGLGKLDLTVTADGRRRRFDGELDVALSTPRVDGRSVDARPRLSLSADADLRQPRAGLTLGLEGSGAPEVAVQGQAAFDRKSGRVTWALEAELARLGLAGAFLPASLAEEHRIAWERLGAKLNTRGALTGVVESFRGPSPLLAADPLVSARGELELGLAVSGLDYGHGDLGLVLPGLDLSIKGRRTPEGADAELGLGAQRVALQMGDDRLVLTGLKQRMVVDTRGRVRTGRVHLTSSTALGGLEQSFVAGYPVAEARLEARLVVDRLASLRLEQFRLANPAGGTEFTLLAAVDRLQDLLGDLPAGRMAGRQALGLSGSLRQELGKLSLFGQGSRSSGRVSIPFRVESGDLEAFRVVARLEAEDVDLSLPAAGLSLTGFKGRIPLIEDLARKPDGSFALLSGPPGNPYSRARFLDVHPFLKGQHFLAVERLEMLGQRIGPIAGNVRVSWGSLAVDQLQVAWKQGKITGQLAADYGGGRPRLFFKGNATGIRPSESDDVLDANATLDFTPDPLNLSGRIQVVRIGKQHLLDVLDWIDPYRESVDVNRVRLGLKVGYPKFLRIRMQDGFLAAKVELGGVAGVVRIDEIRGIALGPLLQRYVAPVLR